MIQIAPSILAADFTSLGEEIKSIEPYANRLHLDIMDGHFVPNISYGVPVIKHIKTALPKDTHLMISDPLRYAKDFAPFSDSISFHAEIYPKSKELHKVIQAIKKLHVQVGVALNPDKPLSLIREVLLDVDYVLIMSVFAGFGGQRFMPEVLPKIITLRKEGFKKPIHIDGGMNPTTAKLAIAAGANVIIAGSSIFKQKNRKKIIQELRDAP